MKKALGIAVAAVSVLLAPSIVRAAEPCCTVTAIDTRTGVVSAQDKATKRRFEFKVDNPLLRSQIRVGQQVRADFQSGAVTVEGIAGRHALAGTDRPPPAERGTPGQLAKGADPTPGKTTAGLLPGALPGRQPPATPQPAAPPAPAPAPDPQKSSAPPRLPGQSLPAPPSAPAKAASPGPLAAGAVTTQAVNPEVIALRTTSDLVIKDLGLTALAEITFNLVNRGDVGINVQSASMGATKMARQASPSGPPITIDIHIGSSKTSIQQPSLGGKQTKNFKVPIPSNKPKCLEARTVKVVVDPQSQIQELREDNNIAEASIARPCPDLAIKSIKRDYEGVLNETYRVKVTIVNKGNAPSPSNQVWATSLPGGVWPVTGWPELVPTHTLRALAPGEDTSFKVGGSVLSANKTAVRVVLDRDQKVEESDETNNFKDDRL